MDLQRSLLTLRKFRSVLLLAGALVLGVLAALGARNYIAEQVAIEREKLIPKRDEVDIVVAKRELRRGELIGPDTMATRRIPKEYVPSSAIRPDRFDGYVGARLNTAMRSGEPLINQGIDGADAASFSTKVKAGIRALTISVDEVNSISGMLQPGDRIDLQLSVRPPTRGALAGNPAEVTAPLMQDVLVLATGRQVRAAADEGLAGRGFTTITVEVSPEQAQKLIVAQRGGRLTALLRNRDDRMAVSQRPLDIHDLLGLPLPQRLQPPPALEVIVGGKGPLRPLAVGAAPDSSAVSPAVAMSAGAVLSQIANVGGALPTASIPAAAAGPAGPSAAAAGGAAPSGSVPVLSGGRPLPSEAQATPEPNLNLGSPGINATARSPR